MKILSAKFLRSAVSPRDFLADGRPQIAFAGKSNVGKSSLLNTLASVHRLARISSTPGCTRLINFFLINDQFYFVDLPGYGYAKVSKKERIAWRKMVESYLLDNTALRLLILILDVRRTPSEAECEFVEWLKLNQIPYAIVITKIDKIGRSTVGRQMRIIRETIGTSVEESNLLTFSARTGEGRKEILGRISQALKTTRE
jgi:GTP-binding protein